MSKVNPFDPYPEEAKSPLVYPSAPEFYAVFRQDTLEVLWFELTEEAAMDKAVKFSSMPEYQDVPVGWHLCKNPDLEDDDATQDPV